MSMKENTIKTTKYKGANGSFIGRYNLLFVVVILFVACWLANDAFVSAFSLLGVFKEIAVYGFLVLGVMPVILTGGIDLSVASMASFSSVVAAAFAKNMLDGEMPSPEWLVLIIMLVVPVAMTMTFGYISGTFVSRLRMPPLVVTLGMNWVTYGLALKVMKEFGAGAPIGFNFALGKSIFNTSIKLGGDKPFLSIPLVFIYLIIAVVVMAIVLKKLRWGREIYATGGNEYAARISGIKTGRVKRRVYMMSGFFAGLAGLSVMTTINGVGDPKACVGYELYAIAACVMGGTALSGGKGNIVNAIFGMVCLRLLYKLILFAGMSNYSQNMIVGGIILLTLIIATSDFGSVKGFFRKVLSGSTSKNENDKGADKNE